MVIFGPWFEAQVGVEAAGNAQAFCSFQSLVNTF